MRNTVEIVVTCFDEASSGSLSPCGRGPGRGGQGSTNRLVRGRGQASSPLSLPSPARGEGELKTGRPLGYSYCAPWKGVDLQWVQFPPGNWVAPAGSYRSGGGGNETVGAFETDGPLSGSASRQAVTRVNVEQASKRPMWTPTSP